MDLKAHQRRLHSKIAAESATADSGAIFPLRLSRSGTARWSPRVTGSRPEVTDTTLDEWLAQAGDRPVVVTGDPGSGKTTVLEQLALDKLAAGETVFFLRMGLWVRSKPLVDQLAGSGLSASRARQVLVSQSCWVILDALDEVRGSNVDAAFNEILEFLIDFPSARLVASCRSTHLPAWTAMNLSSARILPLDIADVERVLGESLEGDPLQLSREGLADEILELCTNPLMLAMTQELLLAGKNRVLQIVSAAQLFDAFVDLLEERERAKRPADSALDEAMGAGFNAKALGYVGWRMLGERLSAVSRSQMADWMSEFLGQDRWSQWWGDTPKPSAAELVNYLSRRPPLKEVASLGELSRQVAFMHLTFRDAFAGRLLDFLRAASGGSAPLQDEILDETRTAWPAIAFLAGRESSPGHISRTIIDLAFDSSRQELLLLAARCVQSRWNTPPEFVGELLISILDAFKNWDKPFDYDLMRASRSLIARLDTGFPKRLRDDLVYFADKYAIVVPREITNASVDVLSESLEGFDETVTINALYTLGNLKYSSFTLRDSIAERIAQQIQAWPETLQDQGIAALKDIGSPSALELVRSVVEDARYSARSRAFAANTIAEVGGYDDLSILERVLLDHSFKYRDSVSWSLQRLAKRMVTRAATVYESVSDVYVRALRSETHDEPGRYAKGNILYSLGVLSASEHRQSIVEVLQTESEPYVLEDGMLCLGLLASPESAAFVEGFVGHSDPAVRLKAAEALIRCGSDNWPLIEALRNDEYRVVRRGAANLIAARSVDEGIQDSTPVLKAVLRRGPIRSDATKQTFKVSRVERADVEEALRMLNGILSTVPSFVGLGDSQEVRISSSDVDTLRRHLGLDS